MKRSSKVLAIVGIMLLVCSFTSLWAQGGAEVADDGKIVIGLSQRRIAGSDWWKTLVDGVKYGASQHGAEVIVLDANGDTVRQNVDVNTLINRNVDAIIINANDPLGLSSSIRAAKDAGIPVIAVNSALDESLMSEIYGYAVEDQVATGARGGYILAAAVAERNPGLKEAKAVIIGGYPGDVLSDLRGDGFMKGYQQWLDENPGKGVKLNYLPMQYGHWIPNDAMPVVRDIATAHPDLKVLFSESCVMQAGIEQALKAAGIWENITMVSYDGFQSVVKDMVDNPDGPVQALTTNEPYRQGLAAVEMAIRAINGGSPEGTVFVETVAFGTDDAAQYYDPSKVLVDTVQ
jgi:ribose transport system substrate-binding protein